MKLLKAPVQKPDTNVPDPTTFNVNITSGITLPSGSVKFYLKPANASSPKYEITKIMKETILLFTPVPISLQ